MTIEDIQMQSSVMQLEQSDLNKEQIASARATVEQIGDVMTEYRKARSHITADGRLSEAGKRTDFGTLQTNTDERLSHVANPRLESLDARIAELEYQTRPQAPDSDPVLELLQQQEVRALIATHPDYQDELQLTAYYNSLAISGVNDLFMRAVENSPIPLISDPAVIEAGQRARGVRTNKDAAKTLRQLRTVRGAIKDAVDTARAELNLVDQTLVGIAEGAAA